MKKLNIIIIILLCSFCLSSLHYHAGDGLSAALSESDARLHRAANVSVDLLGITSGPVGSRAESLKFQRNNSQFIKHGVQNKLRKSFDAQYSTIPACCRNYYWTALAVRENTRLSDASYLHYTDLSPPVFSDCAA